MNCTWKRTDLTRHGLPVWRCARCDNYQFAQRPGVAKCRNPGARGLGDVVAGITRWLGLRHCGGCQQRREAMNRWLPQLAQWWRRK